MLPSKRPPTHPGEILWEEFLVPMKMSQIAFVEHLGGSWTQPKLSAIINGKRGVTEAIALDLADALGTTPQLWLNLQSNYNLWHAKKEHEKVPRIRLRDLPVRPRGGGRPRPRA